MTAVKTHLEVRWSECDPAGIVYHPAYIDWFSIARMHFLSEFGIQYMDDFQESKVHLLVTDVACQYQKSLRALERIVVFASLAECTRARMTFTYEVRNAQGEVCAIGRTRHAFVSETSKRPVNLEKTAPRLWARLAELPQSQQRDA